MLTVAAFSEVQVIVEYPPSTIVAGSASILTVGRLRTLTVVLSKTVHPDPPAAAVYVVVTNGDTCVEPFNSTVPIPLSMLTAVAFSEVQNIVASSPAIIAFGSAEILTSGRGDTIIVVLSMAEPPNPVAVIV